MPQYFNAGAKLYFEEAGQGPVLLLLHGLGSSSADWEYQLPVFARHFRVIAPDFRGFGRSERRGPFTVGQFVADIGALLDLLQIRTCSALGYSMGGAVLQQLALERPQRFERLILSNTLASFRPRTLPQRWMLWSRLAVIGLLGVPRLARLIAARLFPRPEQRLLREKLVRRNSDVPRRVYVQALRSLTQWSVAERLRALQLPVLVLAAETDYFGPSELRAFVQELPDCRGCEIFPGTRHGLPMERPEAFNACVLRFLRQAAVAPT